MSAKNANLVLVERSNSGDGGTAGNGTITVGTSDGLGSLISTGQTNGLSNGTMSLGAVETAGTIQAQAYGSLAVGRATNTAIITTEKDGSLAHGRADGSNSGAPSQISGNGQGAVAHGLANSGGIIGATGDASTAFGDVSVAGGVYSSGDASLAHGKAISGTVQASGIGSHAHGNITTAGSQILASGIASTAFGEASNGFNVQATNIGAFAFGVADNQSISATAQSSFAGGYPLAGAVIASGVASIGFGDLINAIGRLCAAFGLGNFNNSYASLMLGQYGNTSGATPSSWVSTDPLLVAGNGTSITSLANAYQLDKDGRITEMAAKKNKAIRIASGTIAVSARTDRTILCDTSSAIVAVNLPSGEDGLEYFIVDKSNNAVLHNIDINRSGADVFMGGGTVEVINVNSGVRHLQFLGGIWYVLDRN